MSKSVFQGEAFRPLPYTQQVRLAGSGMGGILEDALQDLGAMMGEIDKLIAVLPVDLVGQFAKRRDDCLAQSVLVRYPCLYQLARDIEKAVSGAPKPPPTTVVPPPASQFPIIPVAIGGGLLLAGIIYLLVKKK